MCGNSRRNISSPFEDSTRTEKLCSVPFGLGGLFTGLGDSAAFAGFSALLSGLFPFRKVTQSCSTSNRPESTGR